MRKNKLLLLLALLMTAATGAWATDVYLVGNGTGNWLNGVAWDPGAAGNKMTEQNGVYSITFTNVAANSELQFKFAIDGSWGETYGCSSETANELNKTLSNIEGSGNNIMFGLTETADVTISFNLSEMTYMISTKGMKVGDDASSGPKHFITATYREQTRSLEQPLPYATTIGELYEAVSGESFSDLISTMSGFEMPLTGISSNNTSVVSIGELNGASTPVTVIADGKATISINFGSYAHGIFVSAISPLYANMKDGVKDADKWTVKVGEGQAQALPIGGLKGDGSETVTLQYNGRLKVKGVKATSEAAPAEASVPDGAISGVFSVSDGKQVYFSKGNLRYESSKWSFFDNQYDYYTSYSADAWDHFGWSTSATTYGMNTSAANSDYSGDFVDWGATMGTGWRTLTSDEWTYLFKTRSASTVNGTENGRYAKAMVNNVRGIILFPDTYTHPDGVTAPTGVNDTGNTGWNGNSYTVEDWTKMETAGCVFLPAAGYRNGSRVNNPGSYGDYSSATPYGTDKTYGVFFGSGSLTPASDGSRFYGCSVRLVQEATSGEQSAKPAATVTTAPTGAAIVGVGKGTELVSGGAADGGTLMYAVTTTNTKPASTDGFSDAVPTAQTITASGTVYVWYYVKGDDTHSDSEIAATAIEVPVADIIWDVTNVTDISVEGTDPYEKEGITLSRNADNLHAIWYNYGGPTMDGIRFEAYKSGGFTFTAPTGKAFTKIEMNALGTDGWYNANLGTDWAFNVDMDKQIFTVTWKGSAAASTVGLLTGDNNFMGDFISSIAFYLSAPAAKPAATVTTAPTGAAIVGVGKTTALVSGGVADGGTLWYAVTTTNTKPASTDGFSDAVPTAQSITASGKVYVWYYVKGDDTHSDSEIAATAIEVPVAQVITWNSSNVSDIFVRGNSYTKEGVTLSCNGEWNEARWRNKGEENGIYFEAEETGGYTFTAPTDKAFAKIEMKAQDSIGWDIANLGTGWAINYTTITWTGSAASTVGLLTDAGNFSGMPVNSIEFYLVNAE